MLQTGIECLVILRGIEASEVEIVKELLYTHQDLEVLSLTTEDGTLLVNVQTRFKRDKGEHLAELDKIIREQFEIPPFEIDYET